MTAADGLLQVARDLAPKIATRADETERAGRVPDDLIDEMRTAGLFRLWVPAELGGFELDIASFIEIVEALSIGDGSTGWTVMIGAGTGVLGALLPEAGARQVFADPEVITGGALAPKGTATKVEGGWMATGRWPFASGSAHCDWLVGGCVVIEGGRPVMRPDGVPTVQPLVFPKSDVTIVDTWTVSGLCGTGSNDMVVSDVFVPDHLALTSSKPWVDGPLYRVPLYGLLGVSMAGVVLGIARAALEAFVELAGAKRPVGAGGARLAKQPAAHEAVAKAEASLGAARAFVLETARRVHAEAAEADGPSLRGRALLRAAVSNAVDAAVSTVDAAYTTAGGSSVYRSSPLQRHFRDIHTATQHLLLSPPMWGAAGKVLLGADTTPGLL